MKKMMVSQPMHGKSEEEIAATRERAMDYASQNGMEFVNTLFTDEWYNSDAILARGVVNVPLCFMAKSIENMSNCHVVYFAKGWEEARGCRVERDVATAYNVEIVYEQ